MGNQQGNQEQNPCAGTYSECFQVEHFLSFHLTTAFQEPNRLVYSDSPVDVEENITNF